jgi:organic hydroperoxide reductase OsmC/OhrA
MGDVVHTYTVRASWTGTTAVGYDAYDRAHTLSADPAGQSLALSGDPHFGGDPARLNPEQLLVVAASSCQLLSFLAVAARARIDLREYRDEAEGTMDEGDPPVRLNRITLRPHMVLAAGPSEARVRRLVDLAHRECYIANSLKTEVVVEPAIEFLA